MQGVDFLSQCLKITTDDRISWLELKDHEYLLKTDTEKLQVMLMNSLCESQVLISQSQTNFCEPENSKPDLDILDYLERRAEEYD